VRATDPTPRHPERPRDGRPAELRYAALNTPPRVFVRFHSNSFSQLGRNPLTRFRIERRACLEPSSIA
jgi:hypothetical protein